MNPAAFAYHRPATLDAAIALLQEHGDGAKLLAGGHSLLPVLKLRLAEPAHLVDIGGLAALRGVREENGTLRVGALTTHTQLTTDPLLRARCPLIPEIADRVGDRQVRNRGTLGGTLAHADAAADYPAGILALDAELVARGPSGERTIPAANFFVAFLTTALAPDEILTEIRLPALRPRTGTSYQKLANQASGYAIVGVAAVVTLDEQGRCVEARVGITGTSERASRAASLETALRGAPLDDATIAAAAGLATDGLDPLDDLHAPADYRLGVTRGLTRRALLAAAERARAN